MEPEICEAPRKRRPITPTSDAALFAFLDLLVALGRKYRPASTQVGPGDGREPTVTADEARADDEPIARTVPAE